MVIRNFFILLLFIFCSFVITAFAIDDDGGIDESPVLAQIDSDDGTGGDDGGSSGDEYGSETSLTTNDIDTAQAGAMGSRLIPDDDGGGDPTPPALPLPDDGGGSPDEDEVFFAKIERFWLEFGF